MISVVHLLRSSFFFFLKLIISIECSLRESRNFFMKFFPLHTSCLFFMLLNDNFVDIEKPGEMCSPTFVVDEFSGMRFYIYQSFLSNIEDLRK